jgi:hypothetical protein
MQYTLKEDYKDAIITLQTKIGVMTFNANLVHKSEYEKYAKLGFQHLFDVNEFKQEESELDKAINKTIDYQAVEHKKNKEEE